MQTPREVCLKPAAKAYACKALGSPRHHFSRIDRIPSYFKYVLILFYSQTQYRTSEIDAQYSAAPPRYSQLELPLSSEMSRDENTPHSAGFCNFGLNMSQQTILQHLCIGYREEENGSSSNASNTSKKIQTAILTTWSLLESCHSHHVALESAVCICHHQPTPGHVQHHLGVDPSQQSRAMAMAHNGTGREKEKRSRLPIQD